MLFYDFNPYKMWYSMGMIWTRKPHPYSMIATLLWVLFIFSFSLQNAQSSSLTSSGITQFVYDLFDTLLIRSNLTLNDFSLLVRKSAHVFNFAVLMIFVLRSTYDNLKNWKIGSWLFCLLIAIIDETIQIFSPGRSSQIGDVAFDMLGATLVLALFILFIERKHHAKTN